MEELFRELAQFARENRDQLKSVESWLNEDDFDDGLAGAWEITVNAVARDWRKIVFLAWIASDKKLHECEFEIRGFDPSEWCGLNKEGPSPQAWFLMNAILPGRYSGKQHPNLWLIRDALEEGKMAVLPGDLIRIAVAVQKFWVSRVTIKRAIGKGLIKSYRQPDAAKNSLHLVSESELARHYPRSKR